MEMQTAIQMHSQIDMQMDICLDIRMDINICVGVHMDVNMDIHVDIPSIGIPIFPDYSYADPCGVLVDTHVDIHVAPLVGIQRYPNVYPGYLYGYPYGYPYESKCGYPYGNQNGYPWDIHTTQIDIQLFFWCYVSRQCQKTSRTLNYYLGFSWMPLLGNHPPHNPNKSDRGPPASNRLQPLTTENNWKYFVKVCLDFVAFCLEEGGPPGPGVGGAVERPRELTIRRGIPGRKVNKILNYCWLWGVVVESTWGILNRLLWDYGGVDF